MKSIRQPAEHPPERAAGVAGPQQHSHYRAEKPNVRPAATDAAASAVDLFAQTPPEAEPPVVAAPKTVAGGLPAILSTAVHAWREMGIARSLRVLASVNQKHGFDCPGCAWPDPDGERSATEFCENGAKAVAEEATLKRATPEFFRAWSVAELARQSDHWLGKTGRLTHPLLLRRDASEHYEAIGWDDAFRLIADELHSLSSPDEAIFYTSGRTSNEAAFLYQLFVRRFGTNNLPDCSNMCHESSGAALTETIGVGKGTVTLDDFALAEAIFIIGQNPGSNHPRMLTTLQAAKRRGALIVHINPLPETGLLRFKHPQEVGDTLFGAGTPLADLFLQVKINGDVALLKGIMKELLDAEARRPGAVLDREFIRTRTAGYEEFARALEATNWEEIVENCGVERAMIRRAADIMARSSRTIVCWAMGLTQHRNAVANIQEIVNLLLLRGQIGKPGAGVCPVRGHSNVQGDRTMGIWERPTEAFLDNLAREFAFAPPRHHGLDTVEAIKAMHDGRAKIFFALGGNFLSAAPDTNYTAEALRRTRLSVHVSTKLNRAHLVAGERALILPCLGRTEVDAQKSGRQFVSAENSMGVVQMSEGRLPPASPDLKSEVAVVAALAEAVDARRGEENRLAVRWKDFADNYDLVRDAIARVIPGFEDYNARVRHPGGFVLPNLAREGQFKTKTDRANFTVHALPRHDLRPDQYLLMTIRSHDQFNTTIYGLDDRYRGVSGGRRVVFLNADDARAANLSADQLVDLVSHFAGEERVAPGFRVVFYSIPRRCAAAYFPEANALVPIGSVAEKSNTPASKSVVISLRAAGESAIA